MASRKSTAAIGERLTRGKMSKPLHTTHKRNELAESKDNVMSRHRQSRDQSNEATMDRKRSSSSNNRTGGSSTMMKR